MMWMGWGRMSVRGAMEVVEGRRGVVSWVLKKKKTKLVQYVRAASRRPTQLPKLFFKAASTARILEEHNGFRI